MTDTLTREQRSERMRRVRGRDTGTELAVRRLVHGLGYRFRLHARDLPGTPDLVFRRRRKVIFVHGCFWHRHDCPLGRTPKSNRDFWVPKLAGNQARDSRNLDRLVDLGWRVLVVWECELKDRDALTRRIAQFIDEI